MSDFSGLPAHYVPDHVRALTACEFISITEQFRIWIEESRVDQIDDETKEMIAEMKRKVARHRWKRAISAVRLSYRIAGKPPKWEEPVCAPGCENQNRFVDMNEMVSEAMRKQPKYFREGSVSESSFSSLF